MLLRTESKWDPLSLQSYETFLGKSSSICGPGTTPSNNPASWYLLILTVDLLLGPFWHIAEEEFTRMEVVDVRIGQIWAHRLNASGDLSTLGVRVTWLANQACIETVVDWLLGRAPLDQAGSLAMTTPSA